LIWAGFVAATLTINHSFQKAKLALTVIDGGSAGHGRYHWRVWRLI